GQPSLDIAPAVAIDVPVIDLGDVPRADREDEARRLCGLEQRRPFDLARGPLVRCTLVRLDASDHVLCLAVHHIAADGWSMGVFIDELIELYDARVAGRPPRLAALAVQYADYARWQEQCIDGGALEPGLAYWAGQLADGPGPLELPVDRASGVDPAEGGKVTALVPARVTAALHALGRSRRASLFMVLLGAWTALLHRITGADDLCVGAPVANRDRVELEGL